MPSEPGMAFVLIQHLAPDRESMIAEILATHTPLRVRQVEDGMRVEPNQVYVIRPGHTLTIKEGHLHLGESLKKPGHNRPVDDFFRSLAEEQRQRSIGIIMSGMGSNGSQGIEHIKAVGGVAIAQDPDTAKYSSMPQHLLDSGNADFVLRPSEMPPILSRYASHPYVRGGRERARAREKPPWRCSECAADANAARF
jgi:two-component system, chemotaxis family, CheB/CheR fusion protein